MAPKTHKLTFTFFNAGGGDAIWIRFLGDDNQWHNILIDGGYGHTYKDVFGPLINELSKEASIDLWIITHTDQDHIGAVLGFIEDKKIKDKKAAVKQFWFNYSPLSILEPSGKLGVNQGIKLRDYLDKNGLLTREAITSSMLPVDFWGLKLTILSPTEDKLATANALWKVKESKAKLGRSAVQGDHSQTIEALQSDTFIEDKDPWNGSSIACLIEFEDHRAMLLADSHPSVIVESLQKRYSSENLPLELSLVQLSHHGSKANTSQALLSMIQTTAFVITGNGVTNQHPDKETLVRVLTQKQSENRTIEFIFPAETKALNNLFEVDEDPFKKFNFQCSYPADGDRFIAREFLPLIEPQL